MLRTSLVVAFILLALIVPFPIPFPCVDPPDSRPVAACKEIKRKGNSG